MAVLLVTKGFAALDPDVQSRIIHIATQKINVKRNWVVFDPEAKEEVEEDEGRTLRVPFEGLKEKVYAILDDHGSPTFLSQQLGKEVNTQYTITFLLASEY